ncbi:hypothetical protein LSTR_LSTR005253 [Laodelphax striatellus]|uniref:Uncharacterized protein n=1 Tax=Laodelphax striatellus TaxID=195883 RepID=A0A482X906_LAOST|nr:hypothetical protein LSTR_LSTR005253 [Laodelphax striatellus]
MEEFVAKTPNADDNVEKNIDTVTKHGSCRRCRCSIDAGGSDPKRTKLKEEVIDLTLSDSEDSVTTTDSGSVSESDTELDINSVNSMSVSGQAASKPAADAGGTPPPPPPSDYNRQFSKAVSTDYGNSMTLTNVPSSSQATSKPAADADGSMSVLYVR